MDHSLSHNGLSYGSSRDTNNIGHGNADRKLFFLVESDITELKALATKVNVRALDLAIQATMALRVVYRLIQLDKETISNRQPGVQPTDYDKKTWEEARSNSGSCYKSVVFLYDQLT